MILTRWYVTKKNVVFPSEIMGFLIYCTYTTIRKHYFDANFVLTVIFEGFGKIDTNSEIEFWKINDCYQLMYGYKIKIRVLFVLRKE